MLKWYETEEADKNETISSRVRLARNVKKYLFTPLISPEDAKSLIREVTDSVSPAGSAFRAIDDISENARELFERHIISLEMLKKKAPKSLLLKDDESASVMINEEDHIRIQTIFSGDNIDNAFDLANHLDDLISERTEYAFDEQLGFLTSCPTNVGTGMRASYMLHLPVLESTGQLQNVLHAISKFGITARGIHGEGTNPAGSIYQISNQVTLSQSEEEIIKTLKAITKRITDREIALREKVLEQNYAAVYDRVYRAYAVLKYAGKISLTEAMQCLSDVRLGYITGIITEKRPKKTIYNIMMDIQEGAVFRMPPFDTEPGEKRAGYLRKQF